MASAEVARRMEEKPSEMDDQEEGRCLNEDEIMTEAEKCRDANDFDGFDRLLGAVRCFLKSSVSKAKAAKLVRDLMNMYLNLRGPRDRQVKICEDCINWAREDKRTFLRQALEARLMAFHYEHENYSEALNIGNTLLKELKKVDDKNLLVDVQLLESKTYHVLSNLPRARAALTSARTTANSIYIPPKTQAALDLQSGILHAADEKDFKTAYSYFYEAFEGLDGVNENQKAMIALKYMLLSKIMLNLPEEVAALLSGKLALKYTGPELEAMRSIASAASKRSLAAFQVSLSTYEDHLKNDPVVKAHLASLYDKMMEQNLCRIIEPYSKVEVQHIAKTIELPVRNVELKLSQMILDKKLAGVLDQGAGMLVIFDSNEEDKAYEAALGLIQNMGKVVDSLYHKAKNIT